jgi:hypothetical protein
MIGLVPGRALASGARGREFKSPRSDHPSQSLSGIAVLSGPRFGPRNVTLSRRSKAPFSIGTVHDLFCLLRYDLLSGIRMGDLSLVQNSKRSDQIVSRVQSIIEQHPDPEASEDGSMMEALTGTSKGRDRDATELLVFGDLGS